MSALSVSLVVSASTYDVKMSPLVSINFFLCLQALYFYYLGHFQPKASNIRSITSVSDGNDCVSNCLSMNHICSIDWSYLMVYVKIVDSSTS